MSCHRGKRWKFELAQIEFKVHPRDKIPRPPNKGDVGGGWNSTLPQGKMTTKVEGRSLLLETVNV